MSMIWFNTPVRLWVLSSFCNQDTCYRQYVDYTFTKRFGLPKLLAAVIAFPLSFFISKLLQSTGVIPVFRNSRDIVNTFNQSVSALVDGESLLICPDVDYTDTDDRMGEMYYGFLHLEKPYIKQTERHLAFVPLYISKSKRCICAGEAIYFKGENGFKKEKEEVYRCLKQEFLRLEKDDYLNRG